MCDTRLIEGLMVIPPARQQEYCHTMAQLLPLDTLALKVFDQYFFCEGRRVSGRSVMRDSAFHPDMVISIFFHARRHVAHPQIYVNREK